MLALLTTAVPTEPSNMPANPPRPWLPTTISCARFDASISQREG
jgi:hypothetical protein